VDRITLLAPAVAERHALPYLVKRDALPCLGQGDQHEDLRQKKFPTIAGREGFEQKLAKEAK